MLITFLSALYSRKAANQSGSVKGQKHLKIKGRGKFGDKTEEDVMKLLLPDRLGDNLDILFVSTIYKISGSVQISLTAENEYLQTL